ncbi:MAG: hypothetical protein WBD40_25175 [Tepidisphaeraceae bacterium]
MPSPATTYPDWKAPAEDGQTLLWPEPKEILARTRANQRRLASADAVRLQGVPLPELRKHQRAWIGHADDAQPLIASGHQAELYHPGVWVKDVLANHLAARLGGQPFHFAVDTDSPKHLDVRWPGYSEPLTDDPAIMSAEWSSLLDAPTPRHIAKLDADLRAASESWSFAPMLGAFYGSMRRLSLESPKLSAALTNAMHELDWKLGLRQHAMVMSPVWISEPYLVFVHHALARAGQLATDYNASLAEYRTKHKVRTAQRPMPDVAVFEASVEAPFWLDDLATGHRTRPTVFATDGGWVLKLASGAEFAFDERADGWDAAARLGQWLRENEARLAPRALMLTLFLRLVVADQFIHGIGGGRYDQVTDLLIARHFGIEPPTFVVTTATLYFPGAVSRSRVCTACVEQEGHRVRHGVLGDRKRALVASINAAPRCSPQRSERFYRMHKELAAAAVEHPAIKRWEERLRETQRIDAEDAPLFDRELFYAIQSAERLNQLIERYAVAMG